MSVYARYGNTRPVREAHSSPREGNLISPPESNTVLQTLEGVARMGKSRPEQWSDGEIDKLRSLARTMPVKDLEKNFQRSRGAILAKAFFAASLTRLPQRNASEQPQ